MAYNVLIVEDQALPRQFFSTIIEHAENYTLAGMFSSSEGVTQFCRLQKVDLILMDLSLGDGTDGLTLSSQIRKINRTVRILVVTQLPEASFLKRAKAVGVDSFWYKDVIGVSLLHIMDATMRGEHIYPDNPPPVKIGLTDTTGFTEREMDVLRLMTTGAGDAEIARQLYISYDTVRTHVKHMSDKTGLSRVRLAIEARAAGITVV